jgi:hypothetical protein
MKQIQADQATSKHNVSEREEKNSKTIDADYKIIN